MFSISSFYGTFASDVFTHPFLSEIPGWDESRECREALQAEAQDVLQVLHHLLKVHRKDGIQVALPEARPGWKAQH